MKKKTNYSAPQLEQVKMESEMPVLSASMPGNLSTLPSALGTWL